MRCSLVAIPSCLLICLYGGANAASSLPNRLDLRQIDGLPAGCLPKDYGDVIKLDRAYIVPQIPVGKGTDFRWSLEREQDAMPVRLRPGNCVVFGRPLKGYEYERHGGTQWVLGQTYVLVVERIDEPGIRGRLNYVGAFCVMHQPDKELAFVPYIDHADGTTTYPACGRRIGGPPAPDGFRPSDDH
ncbi:hypothetical protein DWU98_16845 [Dyella monticola]|uniref:DUF3455 domain-containing protein n=1 Tax=Dyella monticola TaxID=1927958 RepID=A0A370WUE1_9GAMM|nr:hypothetical protein [Dyella monticola]RDS79732.1 hypothetical protein DWU98_16845 [Dyella monticola]